MFVIAHLSDPHLDGSVEARERLRRVVAYVKSFSRPVDVVLVTGDLADHGLPAEYDELAAELSFDVPVLVLPGNHDVSGPLRAYVDAPGAGHPVHQVRDVGPARFILMDSTVPGEDYGRFDSLGWLSDLLSARFDGPVFVAFHHPPNKLNHPVLDQWILQDSGTFAEVLRDRPVTALLAGHVHNAVSTTFAGHPLLVAPGIRSAVRLPFEPSDGLVDYSAPPGLALHTWTEDQPLVTVFRFLPAT